jgi:hypothetical protein
MIGPSSFYRQHREIEEPQIDDAHFRPAWRIKTRLDALYTAGALAWSAWQAALRYRAAAELAASIAWPSPTPLRGAGGDTGERLAAQADAHRYLARVRARLGPANVALIEACIVEDLAWAALGRRYGCTAKTARRAVVAALRRLAAL